MSNAVAKRRSMLRSAYALRLARSDWDEAAAHCAARYAPPKIRVLARAQARM
jgi:hypothetical protein